MSLKAVVEQAIADAFAAGAQWKADHRYQQSLRRQQQAATEAVGRGIMRTALQPETKQGSLF